MSRPFKKGDLALTAEIPRRAPPLTARIDIPIDWSLRDMARRDPEQARRRVRSEMVRQLSDFIADNCQAFQEVDLSREDQKISMEIAINDRGSYENWLPYERREGYVDGRAQERAANKAATPYGFEPGAFYE